MRNIDGHELELLNAYEKGKLKSVATKGELSKFKAAARATAVKDRRVNMGRSAGDLNEGSAIEKEKSNREVGN